MMNIIDYLMTAKYEVIAIDDGHFVSATTTNSTINITFSMMVWPHGHI
jgi:hypothetical protein